MLSLDLLFSMLEEEPLRGRSAAPFNLARVRSEPVRDRTKHSRLALAVNTVGAIAKDVLFCLRVKCDRCA